MTIVCLTKSYKLLDFSTWFNYYANLNCKLIIYDNKSETYIIDFLNKTNYNNYQYYNITQFPDQWNFYSVLLNENILGLKQKELIAFIDDDEFLWYNANKYKNINECVLDQFKSLECILLPEILISTKQVLDSRNENLLELCTYRRNDFSSQGKCILKYNTKATYNFKHSLNEVGHVPLINDVRMSDVVGSGISETTYGITDYNADLRLYHYHIKSIKDWSKKIERGSPAIRAEQFDKDITKNPKFGLYDTEDLTMYNLSKKINNRKL